MIGKIVSHYRITGELGKGGMGIVYLAEDTKLGRTVALKFLAPHAPDLGEERERFMHEARAAAALNHPNIGTIYEIDEFDGRPFIVMEHVEGATLKDRIDAGPLPIDEALGIAQQVAQGLQEAHDRDIVHRDVKAANLMLTARGRVKIMDFGLAKMRGLTKLTHGGTTLGTVAYMSPEQARGGTVDRRSDIWSLGVVLYEMITGREPFRGEYEQAVLYSILHDEPEPPTALRTGVPIELDRVVARALAKDPAERYQHADDFAADLAAVRRRIAQGGYPSHGAEARPAGGGTRTIAALAAFAVVVAAVAGWLLLRPDSRGAIDSIAVLPLDNLSADPEQEYFADAMTEALIADLARIGSLKVISRTSIMRFKDTERPLPDIARDLGVDAIVEGSVLLAGESVRITAQLIEAATDRHIWAQSYERDMRNVISLQREVARAIAGEIEAVLTPREEVSLAEAPEIDSGAQRAYMKGRYHWNKRTMADLERCIGYYSEAIERTPDFAMAWAGLAEAYSVIAEWGYFPPLEYYEKAMKTAREAIRLDSTLASPYATIGVVLKHCYFDHAGAENSFGKALSLNPNYATAHQWYAEFLLDHKRFEEALVEIEQAIDLDPLSLMAHTVRAGIYYYNGLFDEAIELYLKTLELESEFVAARYSLSCVYRELGRADEAAASYRQTLASLGVGGEDLASFDRAYARDGLDGISRWIAEDGYHLIGQPYNAPYYRAISYAELGEADRAFEMLEQSYAQRSMLIELAIEPAFDSLRDDPRYESLRLRLGLPR